MSAGQSSGIGTAADGLRRDGREQLKPVPWLERTLEAVVGNRLGAAVYRDWVAALGLLGDERVLDVGTGAGACARHLAEAVPAGRVTCLDVDPRWLTIAHKRLARWGDRVEFVQADAAEWSRPRAFDVATAHFVLHDIPASQLTPVLRQIAASLRPGGRLCVREPLTHGMSAEALLSQLREAGFRPVGEVTYAKVPLMGPTIEGTWAL